MPKSTIQTYLYLSSMQPHSSDQRPLSFPNFYSTLMQQMRASKNLQSFPGAPLSFQYSNPFRLFVLYNRNAQPSHWLLDTLIIAAAIPAILRLV
jgi:hypothetical protein